MQTSLCNPNIVKLILDGTVLIEPHEDAGIEEHFRPALPSAKILSSFISGKVCGEIAPTLPLRKTSAFDMVQQAGRAEITVCAKAVDLQNVRATRVKPIIEVIPSAQR